MQTKTYFASSVPAALEVARQELGEDAMLVSSRPAPPDVAAVRTTGSDLRLGSETRARQAAEALPARKMPRLFR